MLQETSTGQKSMWQINKINTRKKANYQLQYKYTIKSQDQAWGVEQCICAGWIQYVELIQWSRYQIWHIAMFLPQAK